MIFESASIYNAPYRVRLYIRDEWRLYWLNQEPPFALYQAISTSIINQPYADRPDDLLTYFRQTIYHPNHDSSHAIRQSVNTQYFLAMVKEHGLPQVKIAASALTVEENEALKLAGFLFRAARTNELPGEQDPQNAVRSAELFKAIALELEFDKGLVDSLFYCIAYTYTYPPDLDISTVHQGFVGTPELKLEKLNLIKRLLHLSHHTDLVRCFGEAHVSKTNKENLAALMVPEHVDHLDRVTLDYARSCAEATGTPYFTDDNHVLNYPPLYLKARALTDVAVVYEQVSDLSRAFLTCTLDKDLARSKALHADIQKKRVHAEHLDDPEAQKRDAISTTLAHAFFARRAHRITKQAIGVSPSAISKGNLQKLTDTLRQGLGLSLNEKERKGESILLKEEEPLFEYLINVFPWTLKHVTASYHEIHQGGNALKSLHQRNRDGRYNAIRYTNDFQGRSDEVFFTIGGPNSLPAEFLQTSSGYIISVPLRQFFNPKKGKLTSRLSQLWVSAPTYAQFFQEKLRSTVDTTQRYIEYITKDPSSLSFHATDKKVYTYRRENAEVLQREVTFTEETVTTEALFPFLVYNVILELRMVGGAFREECLTTLSPPSIEAWVNAIYESSNFEALLPSRLNLNDARIDIQPFNSTHQSSAQNVERMLAAIHAPSHPEKAIQALLDEGSPIDMDVGRHLTPLALCILSGCSSVLPPIKYLIKQGASTRVKIGYRSLLSYAVEHGQYEVAHLLLETGVVDKREPRVKRLINVNNDKHAVWEAISLQDKKMLRILQEYGLQFSNLSAPILQLMADLPELSALDMLHFIQKEGFNKASLTSFNEANHYDVLKATIEGNKPRLLHDLLALGFNPNAKPTSASVPLLALAESLQQEETVALLQQYHATSPMVTLEKPQRIHLVVVNEQQQLLLGRRRNADSSMSPHFQSITFVTTNLSKETINQILFSASGIKAEHLDYEVLPAVSGEKEDDIVIIAQLSGQLSYPVATDRWAENQWVARQEVSKKGVDCLTRAYAAGASHEGLLSLQHNQRALLVAIKEQDILHVKRLLNDGISDTQGMALALACDSTTPNLQIINALIGYGYDINAVYDLAGEKVTPLMLAIIHHQPLLIGALLRQGARANQTIDNISPLMLAAQLNQFDTLELLQTFKATYANPANRGILTWACGMNCSDEMFHYLVERVDCDAPFEGAAPLLVVTMQHNLHRMEVLLKKGANTNINHPVTRLSLNHYMSQEERRLFLRYDRDYLTSLSGQREEERASLYLRFTGKALAPDLQALIRAEYDLAPIEQGSVLFLFLQQLLQDASPDLATEVTLTIAHTGNSPVFICHGLDKPVVAIHRDLLLDPDLDYTQLCFAVAHECVLLRQIGHSGATITPADRIASDKEAMNLCPNPDLRLRYLQRGVEFSESHRSKNNFFWPTTEQNLQRIYNKIVNDDFYEERIKALRLYQQVTPDQQMVVSKDIDENIRQTVRCLSRTVYYGDFPSQGTPTVQYDYLRQHLPSLKDELFPFDWSGIPSLRLKEFGNLLRSIPIVENKRDTLLREAQDLEIPAFPYLYKCACHADVWIAPNTRPAPKKIPALGYFKDLKEAMLALKNADCLREANKAANTIVKLHPKMVEHGAYSMDFPSYIIHYRSNHLKQLPTVRPLTSELGALIKWPVLSDPNDYQDHFKWVKMQGLTNHDLWQALWIMGLVNQVALYDVMPQQALLKLPLEERAVRDTHEKHEEIPRPFLEVKEKLFSYPHDLRKTVYPYFYRKPLDKSMIKGDFMEAFEAYIMGNFAHFVSHNYHDKHDRPAVRRLLAELSLLARGTPVQKKFVRDLFLDKDHPFYLPGLFDLKWPTAESSYVKFIMDHFELFAPFEFYEAFSNMYADKDGIDNKTWLKLLRLDSPDTPYPTQLLDARAFFGSSRISHQVLALSFFEDYLRTQAPLDVFSTKTYHILDYCLTAPLNARGSYGCIYYLLKAIVWQPIETCQLDTHQCIVLYRVLDESFAFPSPEIRTRFGQHILEKINGLNDPKQRLQHFESLMFVDQNSSHLALQDREFFHHVAALWVDEMVHQYGMDNGTVLYSHRMNDALGEVYNQAASMDVTYLFDRLANKIRAQETVCMHMKDLVQPDPSAYDTKQRSNHYSYLARIFSTFGQEQADKESLLKFISGKLSEASVDLFMNYIFSHPKNEDLLESLGCSKYEKKNAAQQLKYVLPFIHQSFWGLRLNERAAILDSLLITMKEELTDALHHKAYQTAFDYIIGKLLPNATVDERESFAVAFLTAYLEVADPYERQFLLASLLVANQDTEDERSSLGKRLAMVMEHLGPAYVKLGQAVHSHPNTPPDIKADLEHVKGHANPPYRWDLWRLIRRVLPEAAFKNIAKVGDLLGSASYNLAVQVTKQDGSEEVLLLLRDKAAEDAKKGFDHLSRTIDHCQHPLIEKSRSTFKGIVDEAAELSHNELDHHIGDRQHELAATCYQGQRRTVTVAESTYQVFFKPSASNGSGPGYRYLSLANGVEFNDLPHTTPQHKAIRKAVAKALMEMEFGLIFSGNPFDCDRHGRQFRVQLRKNIITLGLYDFGEMSLEPLTPEEVNSLADLVRQVPAVMKRKDSIDALFETHIQAAIDQGLPHRHLMRTNKALLALQDIQRELTPEEVKEIFYKAMPKMHPRLRSALQNGAYETMSFWEKGTTFFSYLKKGFTYVQQLGRDTVFPSSAATAMDLSDDSGGDAESKLSPSSHTPKKAKQNDDADEGISKELPLLDSRHSDGENDEGCESEGFVAKNYRIE